MSTPTANQLPYAASNSKKPVAHVTTPSHLGLSSPAPRSMPSPAATRKDHAGKTPINHPTGSSGTRTLGGTPMVPNLSQTGMTINSSPGAPVAGLGTPLAGLGLDIGSLTPGLINLPTPLIGSNMMPTMSDLGLSASSVKRNEDEERRNRMRKVLRSIGRPKGRVSEEGIARIARRLGFQNDVDGEKLTPAERERKVGNRAIGIGGKTVLIEVELKNHVAQSVQVIFDSKVKALAEHGTAAGDVLLQDLAIPDGISLNAKLDRFAANLDRLARMDRLSSDQFSCFEAITGLHTSLCRLFDLERRAAEVTSKLTEHTAGLHVMCKGSGRPGIHERGVLGMAIDFWAADVPAKGENDGKQTGSSATSTTSSDAVHSLRIEVEADPTALYPPVRVSDAWLPETFELPAPNSLESVPWQDPPPSYLGGPDGNIDGVQKLPELNFVAKLDPPLILPYQVAINILSSVGASPPPMYSYTQFHSMLLHQPASPPPINAIEAITATQSVLSRQADTETHIQHHYTLDVPKPDLGYRLDEIPFAHPRQLIQLLPMLRQWAAFDTTVLRIFSDLSPPTKPSPPSPLNPPPSQPQISLDDLLSETTLTQPPTPSPHDPRISVSISTSSPPTISLSFTNLVHRTTQTAVLQFLPHADLAVEVHPDVSAKWKQKSRDASSTDGSASKAYARAWELCAGDVGMWVEWMRNR